MRRSNLSIFFTKITDSDYLHDQLVEFSRFHRSKANRVCHYFSIPAIAIAVLGALSHLSMGIGVGEWKIRFNLAICLLILTFLIDLRLNWRIALGVLLAGIACYVIASLFSPYQLATLFCIGLVVQLLGHGAFEKRKPAFSDNLIHLFIGPRWLVNKFMAVVDEEAASRGE